MKAISDFAEAKFLKENFDIIATCKDTIEKTLPINFSSKGRTGKDKATEGEISQMRSAIGSLSWVARQCRPRFSYHASKTAVSCGWRSSEALSGVRPSLARGDCYYTYGYIAQS